MYPVSSIYLWMCIQEFYGMDYLWMVQTFYLAATVNLKRSLKIHSITQYNILHSEIGCPNCSIQRLRKHSSTISGNTLPVSLGNMIHI